jgi:hypothetical protein
MIDATDDGMAFFYVSTSCCSDWLSMGWMKTGVYGDTGSSGAVPCPCKGTSERDQVSMAYIWVAGCTSHIWDLMRGD